MNNINLTNAEKLYLNLSIEPIFRTKLNKLLFFVDALYYKKHKKTFSELCYIKLPYGPVPEDIHDVKNKLISKNYLKEYSKKNRFKTTVYLNEITPSVTEEDLKIDDEVKEMVETVDNKLAKYTVGYLSELSHIIEPWKSANYGDNLNLDLLPDMNKIIIGDEYLELMQTA